MKKNEKQMRENQQQETQRKIKLNTTTVAAEISINLLHYLISLFEKFSNTHIKYLIYIYTLDTSGK